MEEILNSRWQMITLGFQIYIFGKERVINEKEEKESLGILQFFENQSIWFLTILWKSINLVLDNFL